MRQQKAARGILCCLHFWLSVSYWQRSSDSGDKAFGLVLKHTWEPPQLHNLASGLAFCAMAILEVLKWTTFSTTTEESTSTEGKAGVPRFDGDPARLSEYAFRVRLRQARELSMAEDEVKKLGPLALRLVDGLRGAALQVARTLPVDELANKEKGVEFLLKSLNSSLAPRSKQEARDLYQAGAQNGGILSRQRGESIASYVLRRRAWYRMMTDLDPDLKLPPGILAEQLLMNAGISDDHRLLIRTAIKGDMDWEKVCEELVAQHSRIHEKEKGSSFGKGYKSSAFKGFGKGSNPSKGKWRSYYVEEDDQQETWESASQSLGGYEDYIDDTTVYHAETAEPYMDDGDPIHMAYQAMVDEGLDEEDPEAVEHAADILQAESEAYHARLRAQSTGHYGFWSKQGTWPTIPSPWKPELGGEETAHSGAEVEVFVQTMWTSWTLGQRPNLPEGIQKRERQRIYNVHYKYGIDEGKQVPQKQGIRAQATHRLLCDQ